MFRRDLKPAVGVRWAGILAVAGTAMVSSTSSFAGLTANNDVTQHSFSTSVPVQAPSTQINQYSFTFPSGQISTTAFDPASPDPLLFTLSGPAATDGGVTADAGDLLAMQNGVGALADFNDGVVIQSVRPSTSTTPANENASAIPLLPAAWSGLSGLVTVMGLTMSRRIRRALR
jgi:hypothetical protein